MNTWTLFIPLFLCLTIPGLIRAQEEVLLPVEEVIWGIPEDIQTEALLVATFDVPEEQEDWTGEQYKNQKRFKVEADEANQYLEKLLQQHYAGEFEMLSLSEVKTRREEGAKYFLDVVLMPKQMKEPKPEAMVASFRRHKTANRMYLHHNAQFHYYFYIRDLQTDDAYLSTRFKGTAEVYPGISRILKQISKEGFPKE